MLSSLVPLKDFERFDSPVMLQRSCDLLHHMSRRRTVRQFSSEPVDQAIVDNCLRIAMSAPSGANRQPWRFVVVENPQIRKQLRDAAEAEEREFYSGRAPEEWIDAVTPLGTDASKPFLETAPIIICVFAESWGQGTDGTRSRNYYVSESVGIATGFLIAALHHAGLATLTHTPSPMKFLNGILNRPDNERPFLILVAGFPSSDCTVPEITKKQFADVVHRI